MFKRASINLPLHHGHAPRWLFEKMVKLSTAICYILVKEHGREYFLERISCPFWFQSLGCVLGFDWHSSGLTTTVCGALKESFKNLSQELGIFICGGKGRVSRRTPQEIEEISLRLGREPSSWVYASRMSAKVDNSCLQDGFNLYHHTFIFTIDGDWAVIQQGMNDDGWARRYHWLSSRFNSFVLEPHQAVVSDVKREVLNLVDRSIKETQQTMVCLSYQRPSSLMRDLNLLKEDRTLPLRHKVLLEDINPQRLERIFLKTYERKPQDFEELVGSKDVGPKTLRALALVSEIIYGKPLSFRDPARFSFAHGGKDAHPYPVDRKNYQNSIDILNDAIRRAKVGYSDKLKALRNLYRFYQGGLG